MITRKAILTIILVLALVTMPAMAAEEEEEDGDYSGEDFFSDHVNLQEANKEIEDSAFSEPVQKGSHILTYIFACAIIVFACMCGKFFFVDGGDGKSKAYILLGAGLIFIIMWKCCTIEGLSVLAGQ